MSSIERMIAEIENYLACPMKDAESRWEQDERNSLYEILERLKREKAKAE
jgi:hypothetical protein